MQFLGCFFCKACICKQSAVSTWDIESGTFVACDAGKSSFTNLVHAWMNRYGACLALMPPKPHPSAEDYGVDPIARSPTAVFS